MALSFGVLGVCWAASNPIGAAPDEPAHYIKAIGVGQGQLIGTPLAAGERPIFGPAVAVVLNQLPLVPDLTREVTIPAVLQPDNAGCTAFNPAPATCILALPAAPSARWGTGTTAYTYLGTYQPFVYFLPGLAMRAATTPLRAFVIGRLAFLVMAIVLIALGGLLCFEIAPWRGALVGILAGITPMVLFNSASLSASSSEVAAGVAVSGALLHLAYAGPRRTLAWITLGLGGAVLACSRALGPLWIVILVATALAITGFRPAWDMARQRKRWSVTTAVLLAAASVADLGWQLLVQPRPALSLHGLALAFVHGFDSIARVLQEEVGVFGWLDTTQTGPSYVLWGGLTWSLVTLALWVGSRRERLAVGWLVTVNLLLTPVLYPIIGAPAGVGVQGRWLLPVAVCVPLLAGLVIARNVNLTGKAAAVGTLAVVSMIAMVQFLAFYQNGRRYAVGPGGPLLFFRRSLWSPFGGWGVWLFLALISCAGIVVASALLVWNPPPTSSFD